jgi:hypothetical protein
MKNHSVEMLRLPHFSENRHTDGGEVFSLMRHLPFNPRKIPGTHFCYRLSQPKAITWLEGLDELKNPMTSSGIKPAIFQLVSQCLNLLCYKGYRQEIIFTSSFTWLLCKTVYGSNFWADKSTFTRSGLNTSPRHTSMGIGESSSNTMIGPFQQRLSTNVWARIIDSYLTGPYVIKNHLGQIQ